MLMTVLSLAGLLAAFALVVWARWDRRRQRRKPADVTERCACGYPLAGLDTIRCPECGRVSSFDATADELGLTAEQLRRAKAKRDARRSGEPGSGDE